MKNGIKFIAHQGLEDALKIEDLGEAKEYLKDFADIFNDSINPLESAFINIFDKISGIRYKSRIKLDDSKYKVWLDAYYELRQEKQEKKIKNSTITESRLIKQATDDLLDVIINNKSSNLDDYVIMDKAYFLKDLINLIKKGDSQCSDSVMK